MTTLSDVALLLRTARKQARLTQAELAERAGVARTTVARMENPSKGDMSVPPWCDCWRPPAAT